MEEGMKCDHVWRGIGYWDGKTPEGQRTGGVLYKCSKCGDQARTESELREKGGTVDLENSRVKPAGRKS